MSVSCPCVPCLEGSPFANLSAEGPEPFYYRALGYCCDGQLLIAESTVDYQTAYEDLQRRLITDCNNCNQVQTYCANATCDNGTILTTICVQTSQSDADAVAAQKLFEMQDYCADQSSLYSATCACPSGANSQTVYSNISQAVADAECAAIPKDCDSESALVSNTEQSCTAICADGTPMGYTVAAGTLYQATQAEADALAYSYACLMAYLHLTCCRFPTSLPNGTTGTAYSKQLTSSLSNPVWYVSSGTLPPGLSLDAGTGVLSGTPTTAGSYTFTITAIK